MQTMIQLYFDVPDQATADKLEGVLRRYAQNDVPPDIDGQEVVFKGSDNKEVGQ